MSVTVSRGAIRHGVTTGALLPQFTPTQPALVLRPSAPRRTKLWEFNTNLHCSIIGTCFSAAELRNLLRRCATVTPDASDHDLHGVAVSLAGRHDEPSRVMHKALDHRHKLAVSQFGRADGTEALQALWREAVRRGDIPGAYWATLTHPHTDQTIIREAFGDVHMLSHMMGAANRADIRRLRVLEEEAAALADKVRRQQEALHEAVTCRERTIAALRQALTERVISQAVAPVSDETAALRDVVAEQARRLSAEAGRRAALEEKLAAARAERDAERARRTALEKRMAELAALTPAPMPAEADAVRLDGTSILYVGGRPNQICHLRDAVQAAGGDLLHHDGGVENHSALLAGLVSRCDVAVFPVDCVSHDAANQIKTLCRKAGKALVPLRSAGVGALLAALAEKGA